MAHFADLPKQYSSLDNSASVILPVPYDKTSTWMKGADKGPAAMLEASPNLELYDIETDSEVYTKGIYTAPPVQDFSEPEQMTEVVADKVAGFIDKGKFVVTMGGEHSISIGAAKAHADKFDDLTVVQFDAHADLRPSYLDSPYNHACVMARIAEFAPTLQVGIRSMDASEKQYVQKGRIFYAQDIHNDPAWLGRLLDKLTKNVYITFDLDAFDPSVMPSTGTPEPGGLTWYEALDIIRNIVRNSNLVGCDFTELCPSDYFKSPDFTTAKLIYKVLSYKFFLE